MNISVVTNASEKTREKPIMVYSIKQAQRYALFLFFFFINFQELKMFNLAFFSIPKFTGLIYLLTIIPQHKIFFKTTGLKGFLYPIWTFFGLLTLVSFVNISADSFYFFDFSLFQNIFLFWVLINHGRKEPLILEKALLSLSFGSISLALLYKAGIGIELSKEGRVSIFGDNANIIGLRMTISIAILILAVLQNRLKLGKIRYLLLLPIPIMFQLMTKTASRVALIAFLLCFISGIFLFKTRKSWIKLVVFAAGSVIFIFIYQFLMEDETLILRLLQSYEEGDLAGRGEIYESIFPVILNNPFLGVGETGYAYLFGEGSPHNVFLEVLCYTGIIGLVIYFIFLVQVFKGAIKCTKINGNILPLLLLIPVIGFLISGQILTQKLGWIIFAYISSCSVDAFRKLKVCL